MNVKHLIDTVIADVTRSLAATNTRVILSDRFLEPPYPAGFRLSVVRHDHTAESGFNELGVSLWDSTNDARYSFTKQITTTDPVRDLPPAILNLFRQFNEQCWTTETLLEAWKDMPCQNYAVPFDPIGIPYLHFSADDTWQAVFDWFSDQGVRHGRPVIERTLYLEDRFVDFYQQAMNSAPDYAACEIESDSRIATCEVPFGDLWTVEYRICAGDTDTPLYSEIALLFDGNPVHTVTTPSNRFVCGRWEIDGFPGKFVRFVLNVRRKLGDLAGYFQGKTPEGQWVSGYLRTVPAGTQTGDPSYLIQSKGVIYANSTVVNNVMPDSIAPYIGVMDIKCRPIYGNNVLMNPTTGQQFMPRWNKLRCGWELYSPDRDDVFQLDNPEFRGEDGCDEQFVRLVIVGNTYDGIC